MHMALGRDHLVTLSPIRFSFSLCNYLGGFCFLSKSLNEQKRKSLIPPKTRARLRNNLAASFFIYLFIRERREERKFVCFDTNLYDCMNYDGYLSI